MTETTTTNLTWIANYIWGIADDMLRDVYVCGKYRDVILPMTVLRRLDAVLEPTKQAVLEMKAWLDRHWIVDQKSTLNDEAGQAFHNTSKFTLKDLRARASRQQLRDDFEDYLDGFSRNVKDILENFDFRNQIPRLTKGGNVLLGSLIDRLTRNDINLSPYPVKNADGTILHPGLDNHGMGTLFEELIRHFNEENNEEAGEHFTPRDAVTLMAKLVFLPVADQIESGTYLLYDGACGTGGMLKKRSFLASSWTTRTSSGRWEVWCWRWRMRGAEGRHSRAPRVLLVRAAEMGEPLTGGLAAHDAQPTDGGPAPAAIFCTSSCPPSPLSEPALSK